jgi:hypothetical protein
MPSLLIGTWSLRDAAGVVTQDRQYPLTNPISSPASSRFITAHERKQLSRWIVGQQPVRRSCPIQQPSPFGASPRRRLETRIGCVARSTRRDDDSGSATLDRWLSRVRQCRDYRTSASASSVGNARYTLNKRLLSSSSRHARTQARTGTIRSLLDPACESRRTDRDLTRSHRPSYFPQRVNRTESGSLPRFSLTATWAPRSEPFPTWLAPPDRPRQMHRPPFPHTSEHGLRKLAGIDRFFSPGIHSFFNTRGQSKNN